MSKLKIFISSTYYDLKHVRNNLRSFIHSFGYEPVLFEHGDIPFIHKHPLDGSCYKEIPNCHMLILIIGGRYGSAQSSIYEEGRNEKNENEMYEEYTSVTRGEYATARKNNIPTFIFIKKEVAAEFQTYLKNKNKSNTDYAHVDSINIFKLIESIYNEKHGAFIKEFDVTENITDWLKNQWAGIFAHYLKHEREVVVAKTISEGLNELKSISNTLKKYSESMMNKILPEGYEDLVESEASQSLLDKSSRFCSEDLILYLSTLGFRDSPLSVYSYFVKSESFNSFFGKLDFEDFDISLMEKSIDLVLAEKEFEQLKKIYTI